VGRNQVDQIAEETAEVVSLGVEENGQRVLLYKSEGADAVYDNAPVGEFTKMHWSALGKAILAELSPERVSDIVETHEFTKRTENTITELDELQAELEEIREVGYAIEDEERKVGIRSVAVPLTDASDQAIGSLSISGPKHRFDHDSIEEEAVPKLKDAANVIEVKYVYD
jgi:DNA-binding IclR family transcriptional regulator